MTLISAYIDLFIWGEQSGGKYPDTRLLLILTIVLYFCHIIIICFISVITIKISTAYLQAMLNKIVLY